MKNNILLSVIITILFVTSCSRNPVTGKRELVLMTKSQEIAMGKEYDPQIVAAYGLYQDQKLQNLISKLGQGMAKISHRPGLDYEFKILDSPVVNAFAVPGGYVYFTRGILAHFNNEAELAGVLGHEIGHITARHSAKQYSRQTMMQALFIGGLIFSPEFAQVADIANQGIGLLFLRFSRGHERESDKLGVQYSTELGYDANRMAEFFRTLDRLSGEGGSLPQFLSTHPDPGQRYESVNDYADLLQERENLNNLKVNRDGYLDMIDGLMVGEDPKQGYVENGKFYHPELLFEFEIPQGWQTNNTPSQVQLIPDGGKAVILFELEPGSNLSSAANAVIERNKINVIEQNNISVHGNQAIAILGEITQAGQSGQAPTELRIITYLIKYNNVIYKFIGLSTKNDFNAYFGSFQGTMNSFKKLTDQNKINKLPTRIKIVKAKQSSSLQAAFQSYGVDQANYNKIAVLNGMNLTDQITAGTKFKILEQRK